MLVLGFAVAAMPRALAQTVAVAQLSGAVTDEGGGVLPGTEVTVTQTGTGMTRTAFTGAQGEYVFTNLPVGPYKLTVKLSGFNTFEQTGIVLAVGDTRTVNVALKVGAVTEMVKVEADASQVETRSTGVGLVVAQEQIVGLPLNGRQATQLVLLSGAAVEVGGGLTSNRQYPNAVAISVAGGTGNSTLYLVDGGYNNDSGNNTGNAMPFPDALQEFRTESGVRPARYGMYTGATVNAVTKSGTNQLHGTFFDFARHHSFNSIPYFSRTENGGTGKDDGLRRTQVGGTVGGPLIHDKLFFFGGVQYTDQKIAPLTNNQIVPTAEVLAGDFTRIMSAACRGGTARTLGFPFVNNKVSPSLYNATSLNILKYIPVADPAYDVDGCGRYLLAIPNDNTEAQVITRGDYQMKTNQRVFARYFYTNYNHEPYFDAATRPNMLYATGSGLGIKSRMHTFAGGWDYVVSPNMFSAMRVSFANTTALRVQGNGLPTFSAIGLNVYSYTKGNGQDFYNGATGGWSGHAFPGTFYTTTPSISEDIDWIKGAHSLSFGAAWTRPFFDGDGPFQANGNLSFSGLITRGANAQSQLPMADFLLGLPATFSQGGSQIVSEKQHYLGFYGQDVWRVSRRVTLNYGLRWEPYLSAKDQNNYVMAFVRKNFDAGIKSTVYSNAPAGLVFPGDPGFPTTGSNTTNKLNQFAPRVGIVWDPKGDNVQTVRAAFGHYYDSPKLWQYGHHMLNPPYGNTITAIAPSTCPPPNANGCPLNFLNPWANTPGGSPVPVPNPIPSNVAFPLQGEYVSMPIQANVMAVTQWNVSYQRQFLGNMLFDVTYMGNRTTGIWLGFEENPSVYIPGNCKKGEYALAADGPCSNTSANNLQARRLLNLANPTEGKYYGSVAQTTGGTGTYKGVRFTLTKRLSHGWSVSTNYTRSVCINQGEPSTDIGNSFPDPLDPTTNEGPCAADRPHIFNLSSVLLSPGVGGGFVKVLTEDWQVGFVLQARSGSPLTPATTGNSSLTGLNNQRPFIVAGVDPNLSEDQRVWVNPTARQWFNMAAFTQNTAGSWGDVPKGYLMGPSFWNADLAFSRNVQIKQGHRVELRIEAFNVFNHNNWANPSVTLGATNAGQVTATANDPRIMQFAIKYDF